MRLATGRWVSGNDFIDRESELRILDARVRAGNHILLTGQRRMGKTSIAQELGRRLEADGWVFLFTDVEGRTCPEDMIAKLAEAVHSVRSLWSRFATTMRGLLENLEEISPRDLRIKFRAALNAGNWRRYGGQLIRDCAAHDQPVLLVIDELPIFLKRMLGQDDGAQRVDAFLSWLREVVQELDAGSLVLIVSGSIGLSPWCNGSASPTASTISIPFAWDPGTVTPASRVSSDWPRVTNCQSSPAWQRPCTTRSGRAFPTMCSPSSHSCGNSPSCTGETA